MKKNSPAPDEIINARLAANLTQANAAKLVFSSLKAWSLWERGERKMHPAIWELFEIKSAQLADLIDI